MKYSKIVKRSGRMFRYNYERGLFEWIDKDDNGEWEVIDAFRLRKENWENKEIRDDYLFLWNIEIDDELIYMAMDKK